LKRSRTRTTRWSFFFQYSTIVFNIIIGIFLVPLYLKYIPAENYGAWLATGNILFWLGVLDPGFSQVIIQRISLFYGSNNLVKVGNYIYWGLIIGIIISIFVGLLGLYFYFNFSEWLKITELKGLNDLKYAFKVSLIGTCFLMFSYSIASINQGLQSSLGIGIIYFIANIGSILLTLYLFHIGFGLVTLGWVILFRGIVYTVGNILYMYYRITKEKIAILYSSEIIKDFASLLSFNFLGKIGTTLSTQINSFFVVRILGAQFVTILKFTQSAPELSKLFLVRPALAIMPSLVHLIGEGESQKSKVVLQRLLYFTIWGLGYSLTGFLLLNKYFVNLWVGEKLYGGENLNILICIWLSLTIITEVLSFLVYSLGDIKNSNIISFCQAIFFIIIIVPSIKMFGINGVVIASIISNLLFCAWYLPYSFYKLSKIDIVQIKKIIFELLKVLFISLVLIFLFRNISIGNWIAFIKYLFIITGFYFFLLAISSKNMRAEFLKFKMSLNKS
jgi:O-antigen/teichoic acid export membrane protein